MDLVRLSFLGALIALGGCAQLGFEEEEPGFAGAGLPAQAAPPGRDYEVDIIGVPESDLVSLLRKSSQLLNLKDRPPPSFAGLRRRAEDDRERLDAALRSEGYYGARVEARLDDSLAPTQVTLEVETGDLYLVAEYEIQYSGAPAPEEQPDLEDLGLHIGMPARAPDIVAAQNRLLRILGQQGHPLAKVLERKTLVDHADKIMTVRLDVDAGPAARFGAVTLSGLDTVDEDYPRGLLNWKAGDRFDEDKLEATRRALARTGLFDSVTVEPGEEVLADGTLPVAIAVEERPHRSIGVGASFSTSEGIGGEVFWEHRNLFGANEQLRISLTAAEIEQLLEARFRKPSFLRPDQDLLIDGALANRDTDAFEEQSFAGATALERVLSEHWRVSAGLAAEYSVITDEEGEQTFELAGIPLSANYDSSDSLLDPKEGARLTATVTPYSGHGEDSLFFGRGTLAGSAYRALDAEQRFVLAARAGLGTLFGEETDNVPANKRFYAGGGGSIRGFEFQSVGPLDSTNDPLGGRSLIELNTELRVRVTEEIGVVPFVDGGTVFDSVYPDFSETLRWAGGLGLRYFSAFGPIRLDVAVPINKRDIDDSFQFYISIGQAF